MSFKTVLAALILVATPGLALAQGCNYGHDQRATMSCAEGTVWDADSRSCVTSVSS